MTHVIAWTILSKITLTTGPHSGGRGVSKGLRGLGTTGPEWGRALTRPHDRTQGTNQLQVFNQCETWLRSLTDQSRNWIENLILAGFPTKIFPFWPKPYVVTGLISRVAQCITYSISPCPLLHLTASHVSSVPLTHCFSLHP